MEHKRKFVIMFDMKRIDEDIASGQFQKCYLLYGEEDYLKRQYRDKLLQALVAPGDTMNFARYEGENISVEELIDLAETMPFFADRRVILVVDSGFFKKSNDVLAGYLPQLQDTVTFLFVEREIDKRSKTFKAVQKVGTAVEFVMPDERTIARWMGGRLKDAHKTISKEAWSEFLVRTDENMENMDKEMEKLLSYTWDKEHIDREDVEAICTQQVQTKIFDMVSAIAAKDSHKAMLLYQDLLAAKEPPMRILYLMVRQFRQMMVIKDLTAGRVDTFTIAKKAGMPEFAVRRNQGLCRNFTKEQMQQLLRDAAEMEEQVKTGRLDEQMAVELLMMKCVK